MKAVVIESLWSPRSDSCAHPRDIEKRRAQQGSRVWIKPRVSIQSLPTPESSYKEVLIQTKVCGICGSDVAMANTDSDDYVHYPYLMSSPNVPGHEVAGVVVAIGRDVTKFQVGEPVAPQCVINCGHCSACKDSRYDECEYVEERGFTVDGGHAEFFIAEERHVHSLLPLTKNFSDDALFRAGSILEPLTGTYLAIKNNGVEAIARNRLEAGAALVIGSGPIGITAMMNLRALGLGKIIVADIAPERRKHAMDLGADMVIDPQSDHLAEAVLTATNENGVLVVFEATGALKPRSSAHKRNLWDEVWTLFEKQREQPRLIFFGQSKEDITINPQLFIQRYAIFTGSHGHTGVWPEVIRLVAEGKIPNPAQMITREIALGEVPKWLKYLKTHREELKVSVTDFAH